MGRGAVEDGVGTTSWVEEELWGSDDLGEILGDEPGLSSGSSDGILDWIDLEAADVGVMDDAEGAGMGCGGLEWNGSDRGSACSDVKEVVGSPVTSMGAGVVAESESSLTTLSGKGGKDGGVGMPEGWSKKVKVGREEKDAVGAATKKDSRRVAAVMKENKELRSKLASVNMENRALRNQVETLTVLLQNQQQALAMSLGLQVQTPNTAKRALEENENSGDESGTDQAYVVGFAHLGSGLVQQLKSATTVSSAPRKVGSVASMLCVFCLLGFFVSPNLLNDDSGNLMIRPGEEEFSLIDESLLHKAIKPVPDYARRTSTDLIVYNGESSNLDRRLGPKRLARISERRDLIRLKLVRKVRDEAISRGEKRADSYILSEAIVSLMDVDARCAVKEGVMKCPHIMSFILPAKGVGLNRSQKDDSFIELQCEVRNVSRFNPHLSRDRSISFT